SNRASCTTSALGRGTHSITAAYSGDATYAPATSGALSQSIQDAPQPGISVSPASVSFTGTSMGTTSLPASITVTNTGTGPLTVSGVAITGSGAAQFSQTSDCGAVAPSASCTI